jgi:hypothetical protein
MDKEIKAFFSIIKVGQQMDLAAMAISCLQHCNGIENVRSECDCSKASLVIIYSV